MDVNSSQFEALVSNHGLAMVAYLFVVIVVAPAFIRYRYRKERSAYLNNICEREINISIHNSSEYPRIYKISIGRVALFLCIIIICAFLSVFSVKLKLWVATFGGGVVSIMLLRQLVNAMRCRTTLHSDRIEWANTSGSIRSIYRDEIRGFWFTRDRGGETLVVERRSSGSPSFRLHLDFKRDAAWDRWFEAFPNLDPGIDELKKTSIAFNSRRKSIKTNIVLIYFDIASICITLASVWHIFYLVVYRKADEIGFVILAFEGGQSFPVGGGTVLERTALIEGLLIAAWSWFSLHTLSHPPFRGLLQFWRTRK